MLPIQDAEGEAVVAYCKPSAMRQRHTSAGRRSRYCGEMRYPPVSPWVNNMAVFVFFRMSPGVKSSKAGNKAGNVYRCCLLTLFAMLFMQL
jgi:hypothetical protein